MVHVVLSTTGDEGQSIALALCRQGGGVRWLAPQEASEEAAAAVRLAGGDVRRVENDGAPDWAGRTVAHYAGDGGSITYLLPPCRLGPIATLDAAEWLAVFGEAARRPWQLLKAAAPVLARRGGRFTVVASRMVPDGASNCALTALDFLLAATVGHTEMAANLLLAPDADEAASLVAALVSMDAMLLAGQRLRAGAAAKERAAAARDHVPASANCPRRIIITGGGGGIARAACLALAASSFDERLHVLLVDNDEERLSATRTVLAAESINAIAMPGDIADPDLPIAAVARAQSEFGGVDAVFSHAGVGHGEPVLTASDADFDLSFAVNLHAAWRLARASADALAATGGSFTVTGSIGGLRPGLAPPLYGASKAAALRLVEQLAVEWGPRAIRVNAVSPGSTFTPMNRLWGSDAATRASSVAAYPLGRMGTPAEIGEAMAFLAGPHANYITGHNLVVDGALSRVGAPLSGAFA